MISKTLLLLGCLTLTIFDAISQNSVKPTFDHALVNYLIVRDSHNSDTVKVCLAMHCEDSLYVYYNQKEKRILINSNDFDKGTLMTAVDTIIYIHYYINRFAFQSPWAKTFTPYPSICSKKEIKEGNCPYYYNYPFELFGKKWIASFSMVRGIMLNLNLVYEGKQVIEMWSDYYLIK